MKKANFVFGILCGALAASTLFAVISKNSKGASDSVAGQQRTIKIAHSLPTTHPVHLGVEFFAKRVDELSGGLIDCKLFPSGQLGSETEYLEKLQSGSIDIAKTSAAPVANFVDRMKVFSLPYLFRSREHFWTTLDGDIGNELLANLSDRGNGKPSGFRGLCFFDAGSRNFYTVDPVLTPADLEGKIIRVMNDPVAIEMMKMFKATPKPMGGGEIYGALQRGNINGAENNPPTFVDEAHFEVCKHFTFDQHSRIPDILHISSTLWEQLSDQEKNWFLTAAREASHYQRQLWQEQSLKAEATMVEKGVTIHRPDTKAFEAAAGNAGEALLTDEIRDIKQRIKSL